MLSVLASGGIVVLLDQSSKAFVRRLLPSRCVSLGGIARLRFVAHIQESYRRKDARIWLGLIWIAALSSAIVLHRTGAWFQSSAALAGLGMAFGGAAGNLMDILRRRYVIDFIDLGWWPVFNLADVGIVVGLTVAFWNQL